MKILRLRSYCYPEIVASSAMNDDIDDGLAKNGIVSINFTPMPTRGVSDELRKKYKKIKYEEFRDGHVIIHRFPMIREGTNMFLKSFRYLLCTVVEYFKGIRVKDVDLIFCYSTPPTQGMLCTKVARKLSRKYGRKVPLVYCLQDIFPDSLVNAGMTGKNSLLWKIGRKIEDYSYRHADRIIVISEGFKSNIMAKGVPEEKIVVIPNWGDTGNIHPVERRNNSLFDTYGLDRNLFYFCYAGTTGHLQNLDLLLDAAKDVKDSLKDVRFIIFGDGAAKAGLERRVKDESIDNVLLFPFLPYEKMAEAFSLGDVGLVNCKPGVGGSGIPSKTWNIMAAGKPILASYDKNSSLASLIESVDCGVVAEAGSREQLVNAILMMRGDKSLEEKGLRGKTYLVTELDKDKCVGKYIETLKSVL